MGKEITDDDVLALLHEIKDETGEKSSEMPPDAAVDDAVSMTRQSGAAAMNEGTGQQARRKPAPDTELDIVLDPLGDTSTNLPSLPPADNAEQKPVPKENQKKAIDTSTAAGEILKKYRRRRKDEKR